MTGFDRDGLGHFASLRPSSCSVTHGVCNLAQLWGTEHNAWLTKCGLWLAKTPHLRSCEKGKFLGFTLLYESETPKKGLSRDSVTEAPWGDPDPGCGFEATVLNADLSHKVSWPFWRLHGLQGQGQNVWVCAETPGHHTCLRFLILRAEGC